MVPRNLSYNKVDDLTEIQNNCKMIKYFNTIYMN